MSSTFHDSSDHTSRKPRQCEDCFGAINPGDPYRSHRGVWEGDWYTYATHIECDTASLALLQRGLLDWDNGRRGFQESAMECDGFEFYATAVKLVPAALPRLARLITEWVDDCLSNHPGATAYVEGVNLRLTHPDGVDEVVW